jgi:hypothetical protein
MREEREKGGTRRYSHGDHTLQVTNGRGNGPRQVVERDVAGKN